MEYDDQMEDEDEDDEDRLPPDEHEEHSEPLELMALRVRMGREVQQGHL